jgi:hypothetical protein
MKGRKEGRVDRKVVGARRERGLQGKGEPLR